MGNEVVLAAVDELIGKKAEIERFKEFAEAEIERLDEKIFDLHTQYGSDFWHDFYNYNVRKNE